MIASTVSQNDKDSQQRQTQLETDSKTSAYEAAQNLPSTHDPFKNVGYVLEPVLLFHRINEDKKKHLYPILFCDEKQTLRITLANTFCVRAVVTIVTLLMKFH